MKRPLFRINAPLWRAVTATLSGDNAIVIAGHICFFKSKTAWGAAYRKKGTTTWAYEASDSADVSKTASSLAYSTTYECCLYLKRGTAYDYSSIIEITTNAEPAATE